MFQEKLTDWTVPILLASVRCECETWNQRIIKINMHDTMDEADATAPHNATAQRLTDELDNDAIQHKKYVSSTIYL